MEHVVFFPAHDGSPAFRRVASLEDAVRLVEHLRNVEGVNEVSVHALEEVPLAFKPYYKVEVPAGGEVAAAPTPAPVVEPTPIPVAEAAPVAAVPTLVPVPEQGDAPAVDTVPAEEAPKEASLGFFAS
jgi:hypothetical protein